MHVLLVLEQRAVQRRDQPLGVALAQGFGADVLDHQQLEPVEQFGRRRLLLEARDLADLVKQRLVAEALKLFYEVRDVPGLKKKPSTSELLDWLKLLMVEDIGPEMLRERDPKRLIPPLHGALLKNEQDVHLFERLAFMARREGR